MSNNISTKTFRPSGFPKKMHQMLPDLTESECGVQKKNKQWINPWTLWCPAAFSDHRKKVPKRMWLCVGISPLLLGLRT